LITEYSGSGGVCLGMINQEKQLHELWARNPYAQTELQTETGQSLRILSAGQLNTDSGPDFFDARISIDDQIWSGNIEMHIRSSDWKRHNHDSDSAYRNVVLHVVMENDVPIHDNNGHLIPTLVLTDELLDIASESDPHNQLRPVLAPCALEMFGAARLTEKSKLLAEDLRQLNGDMEALFQRLLFRRFGMRTNSEAFQQLAHSIPLSAISRQRNVLSDVEAILFGQSGLLPKIPTDAYTADLQQRYSTLSRKFDLHPMHTAAWKFMRMRPSNFPTVRISQLAALLHRNDHLYTRMIGEESVEELFSILDVHSSEYWTEHFRFGITSPKHVKHLGREAASSILINAVATLRFFTGVIRDDRNMQESAIYLLRALPPEANSTVRYSGIVPQNALESQGVLQLNAMNSYVDTSKNDGQNRKHRDKNNIMNDDEFCSEPYLPYFSKIYYDRQQSHRQNHRLV